MKRYTVEHLNFTT